jgi:hypothetical protein
MDKEREEAYRMGDMKGGGLRKRGLFFMVLLDLRERV